MCSGQFACSRAGADPEFIVLGWGGGGVQARLTFKSSFTYFLQSVPRREGAVQVLGAVGVVCGGPVIPKEGLLTPTSLWIHN